MRWAEENGNDRLEAACKRAVALGSFKDCSVQIA